MRGEKRGRGKGETEWETGRRDKRGTYSGRGERRETVRREMERRGN